jgi:hypothetical protein
LRQLKVTAKDLVGEGGVAIFVGRSQIELVDTPREEVKRGKVAII